MKRTKCVNCGSNALTTGISRTWVTSCKLCGTVQSDQIGWTDTGASALLSDVMNQPSPASIDAGDRGLSLVSFVTAMTEDPHEISMALIAAVVLHVCRDDQDQAQIRAQFTAIIRSLESARDVEVTQVPQA